eukprot:Em0007g1002a
MMTNSIVFLGVESYYPPSKDIQVHLECNGDLRTTSRDWVGLFPVGWKSTKDYLTYQWAPVPASGGASVLFPGCVLPQDDGKKYQFCYISREDTLYGSSTAFRFTNFAVDVIDEGPEGSIVELRLLGKPIGLITPPLPAVARQQATNYDTAKPGYQTNEHVPSSEVQEAIGGTRETGAPEDSHVAMLRVEGLVAQFDEQIGLLEKIFTSGKVASDHKLTAENKVLSERLMSCAGEMMAFRERLETEESLRIIAEQQLSAVQQELAAVKSSCSSLTLKDCKGEVGGRIDHVGRVTPGAVGDQDAIEAFQIAYDNMEKYYRVSCAELDACQISLREAELQVQAMGQRCGELEARMEHLRNECDAKKQELSEIKRIRCTADATVQVDDLKDLEQRLQESEIKCAALILNEERYKRTIEELEHQLKGTSRFTPTVISSDHSARELRVCPVCLKHLPHMSQREFEQHVDTHFWK